MLNEQEILEWRQRFCIAYGRCIERTLHEPEAWLYDFGRYEVRVCQDTHDFLKYAYRFEPPKHKLIVDNDVPKGKMELSFPKKEAAK